ncbi:Flp family type IVb pilin [Vibrio hippocampi]|uniref:Flp family type IVb pilin n=1 Tax=Vibrio hippocampi TaxID=654686 RepID=A0ABM8ZNY0_9VIBR|nr:Flp family type IVb pilin [Vibrio hippocampi]CAH0529693.1 hypothetical protein VHP8226_03448 [Vibrio hippocampi]
MLTKLYVKAATYFAEVKNDERGVTAIEYGLIAVAMAVVLGAVFSSTDGELLKNLNAAFDKVSSLLSSATPT